MITQAELDFYTRGLGALNRIADSLAKIATALAALTANTQTTEEPKK